MNVTPALAAPSQANGSVTSEIVAAMLAHDDAKIQRGLLTISLAAGPEQAADIFAFNDRLAKALG